MALIVETLMSDNDRQLELFDTTDQFGNDTHAAPLIKIDKEKQTLKQNMQFAVFKNAGFDRGSLMLRRLGSLCFDRRPLILQ